MNSIPIVGRYRVGKHLYDYAMHPDGSVYARHKIIGRVDNKPTPTGVLLPGGFPEGAAILDEDQPDYKPQ